MDPALSLNGWLRWDVVSRVLGSLEGVRSVLEIGTGLGAVAVRLAREYEYVGLERDPTSFAVAAERLRRLGRGTVLHTGTLDDGPGERFDVVAAFEVLEHIEDDVDALRSWAARVRPKGHVIVSVPAWQHRFGAADVLAGHYRRYDRASLSRVFERAGLLELRIKAYGFPLGFGLQPIWNRLARNGARGAIEERTGASGRWFQPRDELAVATRAVSAPFRIVQRPFAETNLATGWVAVARRPG